MRILYVDCLLYEFVCVLTAKNNSTNNFYTKDDDDAKTQKSRRMMMMMMKRLVPPKIRMSLCTSFLWFAINFVFIQTTNKIKSWENFSMRREILNEKCFCIYEKATHFIRSFIRFDNSRSSSTWIHTRTHANIYSRITLMASCLFAYLMRDSAHPLLLLHPLTCSKFRHLTPSLSQNVFTHFHQYFS